MVRVIGERIICIGNTVSIRIQASVGIIRGQVVNVSDTVAIRIQTSVGIIRRQVVNVSNAVAIRIRAPRVRIRLVTDLAHGTLAKHDVMVQRREPAQRQQQHLHRLQQRDAEGRQQLPEV